MEQGRPLYFWRWFLLLSCFFLGIDDIILILQQNRLRWYGHVLRKEDTDWVKKCMEYEVKEVVQKDCQAHNLDKQDAMDHGRWKKLIKTGR